MRSNIYKKADFYSGIFFFLVGAITFFSSLRIGLGSPSKPGPGFMPFFVGLVLISLSFVLLIRVVLKRDASAIWKIEFKFRKVIFVLGAMVSYGFLLERIGFILINFLFITLLMKYIGSEGWLKAIFGGAVSSAASYFLFVYLLKTLLPDGFLWFF